jgi:CRISPR-associated endonuclease Csn1
MDATKKPYRLGLDLGTNSLGWFMIWLRWNAELKQYEPAAIGPGGVRIFPDGRDRKSGVSNAADRRDARSARKRRDRFLMRQQTVVSKLVQHGLMPFDISERKKLELLDPYELRAKALDEMLPLHHLGRALFHLNQRRGFESNRKAGTEEKEKGAIKQGARHLREMITETNSRTLGEFFWKRHQKRESVRARKTGSSNKAEYEFYPVREHFKSEFDAIWAAQARHYEELTEDVRLEIRNAIFFQRELRPGTVGKCSLSPAKGSVEQDPGGYRLSWAHPLAQRFRILQEITNLEIQETGKANAKS